MTFLGDNSYINQARREAAAIEGDEQFNLNWADKIAEISDGLYDELKRDDVTFDTSTGVVVFPHPNGETAERDFPDWVNAQMFWRDEPEIIWDAFPEIVGQLCDKVIEVHHG